MTATITGNTCVEAWRNSLSHLLENERESVNLIVQINDPTQLNPLWLSLHDPRCVNFRHDYIKDVINTIFPMNLYKLYPVRDEFYNRYKLVYQRAKRIGAHPERNKRAWGTYFGRLINVDGNFGDRLGGQLERVIVALASWNQRYKAALVFHLSSPHVDGPRAIGSPCWQFGEIIWNNDNTIDLIVVYRNHDYFNKAFGNFLGLGQLLYFICDQTNKRPGKIVCHSVHAYFPTSERAARQLAQIP